MLKLILYGYSYGIRSSRKLERACHHNLSFIWLVGGLKPDYRTIARFRLDNRESIIRIMRQCARFCIENELIEGVKLFVDGSMLRANASLKNHWDLKRCEQALKKIDERIEAIVNESEQTDESEEGEASAVQVNEHLRDEKDRKKRIEGIVQKLVEKEEHRNATQKGISYNTTDEECIRLKKKDGVQAGYNAQLVVDEKHGLIVHAEATARPDANQLSQQVTHATAVLEKKPAAVSSDSGYHSLPDVEKIDAEIAVVIPSQSQAQRDKQRTEMNPFSKDNFEYDEAQDEYICPAGKRLKKRWKIPSGQQEGAWVYKAETEQCRACKYFGRCTKNEKGRQVKRFKLEKLQEQLRRIYDSPAGQSLYALRKQKVELPFGHIKHNLQARQLLLRGRGGANAELSLLVTCFNIARMITIVGIPQLITKFVAA